MSLDTKISERIEILRFPLILAIVFIHAYAAQIEFSDNTAIGTTVPSTYSTWVRDYISDILARVSVPLFFAISGFLFFINFDMSLQSYIKKIKSRIKTLLIPFLIWNIIIFAFYAFAQNFSLTADYFTGTRPLVLDQEGFKFMELFFGFGTFPYPVAYQFWFIRDLMILVLLTPMIFYFLKKTAYLYLGIISAIWALDLLELGMIVIDPISIVFFSWGAFWSMKKYNFHFIDNHAKDIMIFYLILSLFDLITKGHIYSVYIENSTIIIGTIAAITLTKYLIKIDIFKKYFLSMAQYSFFIFAFHEPFLSIIRKLSFKLFHPSDDFMILILYFLCPIITIIVALKFYKILEKIVPKLLYISVGGRT